MDTGKTMASGVTVIASGAPSTYHMAPRIENSELGTTQMSSPVMTPGSERKKRGRPRKYKPDESSSRTFSSVQVSSSAPPPAGKAYSEEDKLNVARPINSEKKHKSKIGTEKLDDWVDCSTGSSFLPHVITVNTGEDISTKIMEFSREGPRAVCIISGSGTVSTLTIRHPSSSGGITTYEGLFEILSFSGSFTPTEMPDPKFGTSGRMTITLSGADGRVVVVASFLLGSPHELKPKKHFTVEALGPNGTPASNAEKMSSNNIQGPGCSISDNPTNWAAMQNAERSRKSKADINISLQG
ncbi:AT-hook motif nuclear-localized protein 1 [Sesamum alatum]|uniref:AT-hook motif nuclear-localized protein n=1 Tax=Sesamum alatum TaxID=300844 RepID=A0AAE2CE59_9LAMI|nr:AT-hook motif nuclear-localized protein 1 [Sesamum alatum]